MNVANWIKISKIYTVRNDGDFLYQYSWFTVYATTKNIRSQYRYDEFGNITSETYYDSNGVETTDEDEIIKSQILYAGYQYDEESKYYNLHARYYDPQTARFLQQDTYRGSASDPLSLNLYTYCYNEPVMYYDPTGHELTKWDQAHLSKDEQKKILEYSLQWSHADKMLKSATFPAVISAYENAKEVAHDRAEEIRNKYRTEREYGEDNGHTTYVTENGTVYKDSPASYYYIKNYLSNSASKGTGKTEYAMNSQGINLLKAIELPNSYDWLMEKDSNGIYPYYVGDRGITIGYGHYIGYNEVQGQSKSQSEIDLLKEFGLSGATVDVKHSKLPYKVPGSKAIPINRINEILNSDISIHTKAINNYLSENKITVTQNEFNALVTYRFLNNQLGGKITSLLESGSRNKDDWYSAIVGGTKGDSQYGSGWREREKSIYNVFTSGVYSYQGVEIKK